MIKRIRARFIIITMISVFLVLGIIMTAINIFNYSKIRTYADEILLMLRDYDGKLGNIFEGDNLDQLPPTKFPQNGHIHRPIPDFVTEETPYETRYFTVRYGERSIADVGHIAALSENEAIELASRVLAGGKSKGYAGTYRFLVTDDMVIFVDCTRQLETAQNFIIASIFGSLGGAVCVFVLVFLLSRRAVAPIIEGYERQKRFITDAGHELKTPLTIISASNELIELTTGENENTQAIAKQVARMSSMVKNLSALASIDERKRGAEAKSFSISELCSEMCSLLDPVVKKNDRIFKINIENRIEFSGDEGLIRQLVSLILENAGKYAISFTEFSLSRVGKRISIICSNDATGIKNGNLSRCFERFYRSDEARASGIEGSGIGLCLASEIVELHDGEISAYGQDNIFTIKILL